MAIDARRSLQGGTVTATVLTPDHVEIDGHLYTAAGTNAAAERARAKAWRLSREFGERLRTSVDPVPWGLWGALLTAQGEEHRAATTELLGFVGKFLIDERRADVWRLLYLELRHRDAGGISEAITDVLLDQATRTSDRTRGDEYREGDECLFVLGPNWRMYLDEGDAEEEASADAD